MVLSHLDCLNKNLVDKDRERPVLNLSIVTVPVTRPTVPVQLWAGGAGTGSVLIPAIAVTGNLTVRRMEVTRARKNTWVVTSILMTEAPVTLLSEERDMSGVRVTRVFVFRRISPRRCLI